MKVIEYRARSTAPGQVWRAKEHELLQGQSPQGGLHPASSFSIMNRALLHCIAVRKFGVPEIAELLKFFGDDPPACGFCGARPIIRWDHLVPVSKGGDRIRRSLNTLHRLLSDGVKGGRFMCPIQSSHLTTQRSFDVWC